MMLKKLLIVNLFLVIAIIVSLFLKTTTYAADWYAPSLVPADNNFTLEDFKYDYNPSINRVTMTYQYKNITGSTINSPRVVNLFLWSNDICSTSWPIMNYDGSGTFANLDQSATEIEPDGYFDWHSLITSPTPPMDSNGMFPTLTPQYTQGGTSYPYWNICTTTPGQWANDEIATFSTSWTVSNPYWIQSESLIVNCEGVDCPAVSDIDGDAVIDCDDNCPKHFNPGQEDTYPPGGNGIGDACECEADFTCDGDVDAEDVTTFLIDFGRNSYNNPCANGSQCKGDFECDGDVDATDVTKFLEDFGRNIYNNSCPAACVEGDYCAY